MNNAKLKKEKRKRRHKKIRARIFGTKDLPRLSVFKSNKHISAQIINDEVGLTLASAHSREVKSGTISEKSGLVGETIALKAKAKKVSRVVFDRGGFIYTGNVKALAEGARRGGLKF